MTDYIESLRPFSLKKEKESKPENSLKFNLNQIVNIHYKVTAETLTEITLNLWINLRLATKIILNFIARDVASLSIYLGLL